MSKKEVRTFDIHVLPLASGVVIIYHRDRLIITGLLVRSGVSQDIQERDVWAIRTKIGQRLDLPRGAEIMPTIEYRNFRY